MANIEQVLIWIEIIITFFYFLIWLYLMIITTIRMIKKLKQQYIDWIYVIWCLSILLALLIDVMKNLSVYIFFFLLGMQNTQLNTALMMINCFSHMAFYAYTSFSTLYPALLVFYSYRLNYLKKGSNFFQQ